MGRHALHNSQESTGKISSKESWKNIYSKIMQGNTQNGKISGPPKTYLKIVFVFVWCAQKVWTHFTVGPSGAKRMLKPTPHKN